MKTMKFIVALAALAALGLAPSRGFAQSPLTADVLRRLAADVHLNGEDVRVCGDGALLRRGVVGCPASELQALCGALRAHPTRAVPEGCAVAVLRLVRACRATAPQSPAPRPDDYVCRALAAPDATDGSVAVLQEYRAVPLVARVPTAGGGARPSEEVAHEMIDRHEGAHGLFGATDAAAPTDPTAALVLGVTSFFVERAKAETLIFLQEQLARDLCDEERNGQASGVAALLSNTCAVFRGARIQDAGGALGALPQAFRRDLDALPWRLIEIVLQRAGVAHRAELRVLAEAGWRFVVEVRDAGVLRALEHFGENGAATDAGVLTLKRRVRVARTFLVAVRALAAREGARELAEEALDGVLVDLRGQTPETDAAELEWVADHRGLVVNLLAAMERVRTARGDESREAVRALHESLFAVLVAAVPDEAAWREDVAQMFEAYRDFAGKKYVAGVAKLVALPCVRSALTGMPDGAAKTVLTNLTRHLALAAAVAEAERPEDVQAALEAAAAPLRSYRVFRRRPFAMFVSGWLGAFSGYELPLEEANRQSGAFVAPSLLVGVELGGRITENHGWSWNVMVSVFDLGAPASVRLGGVSPGRSGESGEARQTPELTFESVFAPGVHVGVGIADTPLVLAAGVQLAPAARQYFVCPTGTGTTCEGTETVSTLRFDVGLAMDLPVLPIW